MRRQGVVGGATAGRARRAGAGTHRHGRGQSAAVEAGPGSAGLSPDQEPDGAVYWSSEPAQYTIQAESAMPFGLTPCPTDGYPQDFSARGTGGVPPTERATGRSS